MRAVIREFHHRYGYRNGEAYSQNDAAEKLLLLCRQVPLEGNQFHQRIDSSERE